MSLPESWDPEPDFIAVVDLDRDGSDEIVARQGGNTWSLVGVATIVGCRLVDVPFIDGRGELTVEGYGYGGGAASGRWGDVICRETTAGIVEIQHIETVAEIVRDENGMATLQAEHEWSQTDRRAANQTRRRWKLDGGLLVRIGETEAVTRAWDDLPFTPENTIRC